ncbi:MAG: prepilin-type N-terminal cleavage/methylation domain-containing protein [Kiritimatiellales bacterium]
MKTKKNKKSGFTLVELMIVAAIIAILAAIVIPLLAANRQRAIAAEGQNLLGVAASACKVYYAENGTFPTGIGVLPQQTQDELGRGKYFPVPVLSAGGALGGYTLTATAGAAAGDLSGETITLVQGTTGGQTWGGTMQTKGIIKQ